MRRLLKFLHTMGAIGFMGAMACLLVLMSVAPAPTSLASYALSHSAMAAVAKWVLFPSFLITLIAGLLSIAVTPGFHNAGWAWAKLATGVLLFEGSLMYIIGPIEEEARRSASALAGHLSPLKLTGAYGAEQNSIWILLFVSAANVALGVWRPRLTPIPD